MESELLIRAIFDLAWANNDMQFSEEINERELQAQLVEAGVHPDMIRPLMERASIEMFKGEGDGTLAELNQKLVGLAHQHGLSVDLMESLQIA